MEIPCTNKVICLSKPPRPKSLSSKLNVGNNCEQTFTCLPHVCALKYISGNMLPERGEGGGRGEFSDLIWPIRGCAAGQGWFLSSLF